MRPADSALPGTERLFRSIAPSAEYIDGDRVLGAAVQLPSTSCNREKYGDPESVLVPERPADTGVIGIRAGDVPLPSASPNGVPYDWIAADDPLPHNEAHAEVRLRRGGVYDKGHRPNSKPFREQLRSELASRFRVVIPPT